MDPVCSAYHEIGRADPHIPSSQDHAKGPLSSRPCAPARFSKPAIRQWEEIELADGDDDEIVRSRSVGVHLGLAPRQYQSGEVDCSGRISRCGDTLVRTLMYEAAVVILSRLKIEQRIDMSACSKCDQFTNRTR